MKVCPDPAARRCDIWLPREERNRYPSDPAFQAACRQYRQMGYQVCLYLGGEEPLLPHVDALLDLQSRRLV